MPHHVHIFGDEVCVDDGDDVKENSMMGQALEVNLSDDDVTEFFVGDAQDVDLSDDDIKEHSVGEAQMFYRVIQRWKTHENLMNRFQDVIPE